MAVAEGLHDNFSPPLPKALRIHTGLNFHTSFLQNFFSLSLLQRQIKLEHLSLSSFFYNRIFVREVQNLTLDLDSVRESSRIGPNFTQEYLNIQKNLTRINGLA